MKKIKNVVEFVGGCGKNLERQLVLEAPEREDLKIRAKLVRGMRRGELRKVRLTLETLD